jgi:hypothetical protein
VSEREGLVSFRAVFRCACVTIGPLTTSSDFCKTKKHRPQNSSLSKEYENVCIKDARKLPSVPPCTTVRLTLKTEAVDSSETSVYFYQTIRCHVPKKTVTVMSDFRFSQRCFRTLKSSGMCVVRWVVTCVSYDCDAFIFRAIRTKVNCHTYCCENLVSRKGDSFFLVSPLFKPLRWDSTVLIFRQMVWETALFRNRDNSGCHT